MAQSSVTVPQMSQCIKNLIIDTVLSVENGGFEAAFAIKGNSGLSFGEMQNDVGRDASKITEAERTLRDILSHDGKLTAAEINAIITVAKTPINGVICYSCFGQECTGG